MNAVDRGKYTTSASPYLDAPQVIGYGGVTISAPHMVNDTYRKYLINCLLYYKLNEYKTLFSTHMLWNYLKISSRMEAKHWTLARALDT